MNIFYLIDVGSSTIKVYRRIQKKIELFEQKTFSFKSDFSFDEGLSEMNKNELYSYFYLLIKKYNLNNQNTKIYATGIFRDILCKQDFIKEFFDKTGLYFNIISQDLEAFYLEKALLSTNSMKVDKMIAVNIGGKTTEILMYEFGKLAYEPIKISLGVGTINQKYPSINDKYSKYSFDEIVESIENYIKNEIKVTYKFENAIYTGGELTYMTTVGYPLVDNMLFDDIYHKYMINIIDYETKNREIFSTISLDELKKMMPKNPKWMNGARACSAIAQAIFNVFNVKNIIPSDSNLINGINKQEARTVTICGSFNKHLQEIKKLVSILKANNIDVLSPKCTDVIGDIEGFILFKNDIIIDHNTWSVEELHLKAIDNCDIVIACNYDNYVGISTSFELDYAYRRGKKIVFVEDNDIASNFGKRFGIYNMPCEIGLLF